MNRASNGIYRDALDEVWHAALTRTGWNITISDNVYASWDGRTTLTVCPPEQYDPDDSLAQLILHELCHALVQGPANRKRVDWGLDNTDDDGSAVQEHACHRLQAALLDLYGLRELLAVTTDWRPYWEALPADPLADATDPATALAVAAWPEALRGPLAAPLHAALRATADIADAVRPFAAADSLWARTRARTPVGLARGPQAQTCGTCAWRDGADCVAVDDAQVDPAWPACLRWEAAHTAADCRDCGACCHEGFHLVGVEPDEPILGARPDLVRRDEHGWHVPRPAGRCVALAAGTPYTCVVYALRPRACADFEIDGAHCLQARRRTGRSRR
ncbi:MAG: YkgJ family cysteine cluster protein [Alphaproteobacteria bacterium]|nr:YkgJ family cysteine cluster protein [Alphaproteobacteria bacterium]